MAARKPAAKPEPKDELPDSGVRVNSVSRDRDGNVLEAPGYRLQVEEGASDADKAAAWNNGGEMPPEGLVVYFPKTVI